MTAPLHDLLDELAEAQRPDPAALATRAWVDGRRRRGRRRLRTATAAVAALGVLLLLVPAVPTSLPAPRFARADAAGVEARPEHIGRQWWVRELPDRPGPLAALLWVTDGEDGWHAVAPDGHRWRLPGRAWPDFFPSLSPDGRRLGQLVDLDGPYVVHDLVTGGRTTFEDVGAAWSTPATAPLQIAIQSPSSWSPDGRHVVVDGHPSPLLLDVQTGTATALPFRAGLAGWTDDARIAWLDDRRHGERPVPGVRLVTTDTTGRVLSTVPLRPAHGELASISQWSGAVSDDGPHLAVVSDDSFDGTSDVRRFSTLDGSESAPPVPMDVTQPCAAAFAPAPARAGQPGPATGPPALVVPTRDGERFVAQEVTQGSVRPFAVAAPGATAACLVWARDALGAPAVGDGPLRRLTSLLTWWERELLLVGLAATTAVGLVRVALRRRRA